MTLDISDIWNLISTSSNSLGTLHVANFGTRLKGNLWYLYIGYLRNLTVLEVRVLALTLSHLTALALTLSHLTALEDM